MANETIKRAARNKGVFLYEIADKFGMIDTAFSRKLRKEFTQDETELALRYIDEIAADRG